MSSPDSKEINLVRCIKCGKILKCSRYDTAALLDHIRTDHPEVDIVDTDTKQRRTQGTEIIKSPKQYRNPTQEDEIRAYQYSDGERSNLPQISYENTDDEGRGQHWPKQPRYVKDVDLSGFSATSELLEKYPEIKECEYSPNNPNAQVVYTRRYKVSTPSPISSSVLKQPFQRTLYRTSIERWCPADGTIYCPKCGCNKRPLIKIKAERLTTNECGACCLLSCWPFCFIPWILPGQNNEYLYCANCKTFLGLYERNTNCVKPNRLYTSADQNGEQANTNRALMKDNKLLENESPPRISAGDSVKSKQLSSIIVNGKELPPEAVARIQKLKKFSSLVGVNLDDLENSPKSTKRGYN